MSKKLYPRMLVLALAALAAMLLAACEGALSAQVATRAPGAEDRSTLQATAGQEIQATEARGRETETAEAEASHTAMPDETGVPGQEAEMRNGELAFTGVLEAVAGNAYTISGMMFVADAQTRIESGLTVGAAVRVEAQLRADGALYLRQIAPAVANAATSPAPGLPFEFVGAVEAMGPTAWKVSGQAVQLAAGAEIAAGLKLGDLVKVQGAVEKGAFVAREIKPAVGQLPGAAETEVHKSGTPGAAETEAHKSGTPAAAETEVHKSGETPGAPQATETEVHKSGETPGAPSATETEVHKSTGTPEPANTVEPTRTPEPPRTAEPTKTPGSGSGSGSGHDNTPEPTKTPKP